MAIWLLALPGGCSTEPDDQSLAPGTTVEATLDQATTESVFPYTSGQIRPHVVFVEVDDGLARILVRRAGTGIVLATSAPLAPIDSLALSDRIALRFDASANTAYEIVVSGVPSGSEAHLRFAVETVDAAPESLATAELSAGDTVSTEALGTTADRDEFFVPATGGQELLLAGEALGPVHGRLLMSVFDGDTRLASRVLSPSGPALMTGALGAPRSGKYTLRFESDSAPGAPRYAGSYRFWTRAVDPSPEHRAAAIALNAEVTGEQLDFPGDVDEFGVTIPAGGDIDAVLQSSQQMVMTLRRQGDPATRVLASVATSQADTALFAHSTGRLALPPGNYVARVAGASADSLIGAGPFRLMVYPVSRSPEHATPAVALGDSVVGEGLERPGDVDEFKFPTAAGQDVNVFFQSVNPAAPIHLRLIAIDADGTVLRNVVSADTVQGEQVSGRFTTRTSGTHTLRVQNDSSFAEAAGPYRLRVIPIHPAPESSTPSLALNDSVTTESIDVEGDVDDWTMVIPRAVNALIALELVSGNSDLSIGARLLDTNGTSRVAVVATSTGQRTVGTTAAVTPGVYRLRVDGSAAVARSHLKGAYRVAVLGYGPGPELTPDTIAIGDTISSETVLVPGDADQYVFHGVGGQEINVMLQALPGATAPMTLQFGPMPLVSTLPQDSLGGVQFVRQTLATTNFFTVKISSSGIGPYRFAVIPVASAPEHGPSVIAAGDSILEQIDKKGDADHFVVAVPPGGEFGATFEGTIVPGSTARITLRNPVTGVEIAHTDNGAKRYLGPYAAPSGGQVGIEVSEFRTGLFGVTCGTPDCGGLYQYTGSYGLKAVTVNRAPEIAPPAIVPGDTVKESIQNEGDIDEFTLTAAPNSRVHLQFRVGPAPPQTVFTLLITDSANNILQNRGVTEQVWSDFGVLTLPSNGILKFRISGAFSPGSTGSSGPYQFLVTPF